MDFPLFVNAAEIGRPAPASAAACRATRATALAFRVPVFPAGPRGRSPWLASHPPPEYSRPGRIAGVPARRRRKQRQPVRQSPRFEPAQELDPIHCATSASCIGNRPEFTAKSIKPVWPEGVRHEGVMDGALWHESGAFRLCPRKQNFGREASRPWLRRRWRQRSSAPRRRPPRGPLRDKNWRSPPAGGWP